MIMSKTLYILVGLPGSGKSWYATHELKAVRRVSQDDMGRDVHMRAFTAALAADESVVVDRVNFDRSQRERYITPARQRGYHIVCVWFDVDRATCMRRLSGRKGHPTVSKDDDHERIVGHFAKMMVQPLGDEYDELRVVSKRTHAKVEDIRDECEGRRTIVVGDIHGCFDEFMLLLQKCGYSPEDIVVSVGDLTDRGPKSRETLEWFYSTPGTHVAEGNHCNKLRRLWSGRRVKISNGLGSTIEQCDGMDHKAIAAWMSLWPQIIRVPDIGGLPAYVVHAGVDGTRPIDRQKVEDCLYARCLGGKDYFDEDGGAWWYHTLDGSFVVLSGHAIHDNPRPVECAYLLDGGAFQGGTLRALVINGEGTEVFEVDSSGYVTSTEPKTPVQAREELVAEGLIRKDELGDLAVYTYTDACVHARMWDNITINSRGHVFNRVTGECVAWSFPKFFNMGEMPETQEYVLPWTGGFAAFEKMDGWLGNLYRLDDGQYAISTRGSFKSPGALWATQFLRDNHDLSGLPDDVTLVFELISPITRIIVDYGDKEALTLLAAFNRHTGEEYAWHRVMEWASIYKFITPTVYCGDFAECRATLAHSSGKDMEGFVVRFHNGLRVKVKGEDYLRRAKIVSNMTPLSVWGAMSSGKVLDEYRDAVDADYRGQLDAMADELEERWAAVNEEIDSEFACSFPGMTAQISDEHEGRKGFAERVGNLTLRHRRVMFARLDGKSELIDKYIMGIIRPHNNEMKVINGDS